MTTFDDLYYIRQIKRGEVDAFVHIVRQYEKMVFTIVNKIIPRREEAEDLTQEIFLKVFESLDKFREEAEFTTWLYRIAYNTSISELRKHKNVRLAIDDNYDNIADENLLSDIDEVGPETQMQYLEQVLNTMPQEDALLITMFYLNEQTIKQISEITGFSVANVKVRLYRIRKYMNIEMNKLIKQ